MLARSPDTVSQIYTSFRFIVSAWFYASNDSFRPYTTMSAQSHDPTKTTKATYTQSISSSDEDDRVLQEIGYVPSFRREFSNLATVRARVTFISDVS